MIAKRQEEATKSLNDELLYLEEQLKQGTTELTGMGQNGLMKSDAKNQVFLMKKFQKKSKPKHNFENVSDKCPSYDIKHASHQPLWTLQRRSHLNKREDEYEREADHVAEQILQMTDAGFRSQRERGSDQNPLNHKGEN